MFCVKFLKFCFKAIQFLLFAVFAVVCFILTIYYLGDYNILLVLLLVVAEFIVYFKISKYIITKKSQDSEKLPKVSPVDGKDALPNPLPSDPRDLTPLPLTDLTNNAVKEKSPDLVKSVKNEVKNKTDYFDKDDIKINLKNSDDTIVKDITGLIIKLNDYINDNGETFKSKLI
ncbi:MAG: hypothetical protein LBS60_03100 [Deltaproteobacteria bacterium]|jgi:hypothetical protein|nr:hypothetical protein [Deltaproteobacteria bacterium]